MIRELCSLILVDSVANVRIRTLHSDLAFVRRQSRHRSLRLQLRIQLQKQLVCQFHSGREEVDATHLHPVLKLEFPARVYLHMLQRLPRSVVRLARGLKRLQCLCLVYAAWCIGVDRATGPVRSCVRQAMVLRRT